MEKEFVNYTEAVALKELGFDEECFGYYTELEDFVMRPHLRQQDCINGKILAPLYQQAFRWFVKMYDLHITIHPDKWCEISKNGLVLKDTHSFDTNEEAKLECLKELIEIVKVK